MDRGFGTMLSIDVADWDAAASVTDAVAVWTPATSLGGVESLIEHRATVEPPGSPVPLSRGSPVSPISPLASVSSAATRAASRSSACPQSRLESPR